MTVSMRIVANKDAHKVWVGAAHFSHAILPQAQLADRISHCLSSYHFEPDGEDSTGQAKLKHVQDTPAFVAQRACDIAAALFEEYEKRGWLVPYPEKVDDQ